MTLAEIQLIRQEAGSDKLMIVSCDNEHIFYHNMEDSCPLIWDDDNERFISFEKNCTSAQSQEAYPCRVVYTSYEHIQYIEVLTNTADVISILNKFKSKMTQEQYNTCIRYYSTGASIRMAKIPNTFPDGAVKEDKADDKNTGKS